MPCLLSWMMSARNAGVLTRNQEGSSRGFSLTPAQTETALKNALRYVPENLHEILAPEFLHELVTYGRIYAYRYHPPGRIYGKPVDAYKGRCLEGRAFQVMIDNNLDFEIAPLSL